MLNSVIMGRLDGNLERVAFDIGNVKQILSRYKANMVFSADDPALFLEVDGHVCPVREPVNRDDIKPYFIVLESGVAFNVSDYQLLFNVKELSSNLLSGTDVTGHQYLCRQNDSEDFSSEVFGEKPEGENINMKEMEGLKDMIKDLKKGQFFEALTMEFSGKIKEIAQELIDFRKDLQKKIEPGIVEMASRDIPEASNQLEGINETLEESTMRIMDINEEQMEIINSQQINLGSFISGDGNSDGVSSLQGNMMDIIKEQKDVLKSVGDLCMKMMEPLSFQDLVGQRIQKVVKLVKSMEVRIEDLIISFGIKVQKHKEDPNKSFEELKQEVAEYKSELKGPLREGKGMDQAGIDELLAAL